ncbi:hypothetical protein, partial [Leisingera sp. F5]|uniref:hypothetical protein n=1 Tax=Leisingera sp. F5 TaxID=1813816 RepID=UPI0025C6536F
FQRLAQNANMSNCFPCALPAAKEVNPVLKPTFRNRRSDISRQKQCAGKPPLLLRRKAMRTVHMTHAISDLAGLDFPH